MKRTYNAAAALAAVAVLGGLGGCTSATSAAAEQPAKTEPAARTAAACETPSAALLGQIGSTLTGATAGRAAAVRSADFEHAYFVAVRLRGPGMAKAAPAVFATNDLAGGMVFAVGGTAHQFSSLGHGETTAAAFTSSSDGYAAAAACL